MTRKHLMIFGLVGAAVTTICCFTPILAGLLGVVGLGAATGYLDYVLLPALAGFLGLAVCAGARQRQVTGGACCTPHESESRER